MLDRLRAWRDYLQMPAVARAAVRRDRAGLRADPGIDAAIDAATDWLCRAQDMSASADGGVARDYGIVTGWASSYPETTGYIIPTFLRLAGTHNRADLRERAVRMLDWCERIQLADGGFQGGKIDATPVVSVTFNTGQILLGLAAGVADLGRYQDAMHRAAVFLRDSLDDDGCWRRHQTPFATPGEKAYETHVAWSLFEADRVAPGHGYGNAGLRQVDWALTKQSSNGWVDDCCLQMRDAPLTHTLGYFLKGVLEAHRYCGNETYLAAGRKTAEALRACQRDDGALPGRLRADWSAAVPWSCLTGNVQIADSWLYLYRLDGDENYLRAARAATAFVRRTMLMDAAPDVRGGVAGAFPIDGHYGRLQYLNWAAKFMIDALLSEKASG